MFMDYIQTYTFALIYLCKPQNETYGTVYKCTIRQDKDPVTAIENNLKTSVTSYNSFISYLWLLMPTAFMIMIIILLLYIFIMMHLKCLGHKACKLYYHDYVEC